MKKKKEEALVSVFEEYATLFGSEISEEKS